MGNYISCPHSIPVCKSSTRGTKVIFPTGETRRLHEPTKAAELMMETPNFFIVNTKSLQVGRRFSALNADEDLETANVYVFFPMKRLNTMVTAADMSVISPAANHSGRRACFGSRRILPDCGGAVQIVESIERSNSTAPPVLNFDEIEDFSTPEFQHRLSVCRSRKPLLETIVEEPISLR